MAISASFHYWILNITKPKRLHVYDIFCWMIINVQQLKEHSLIISLSNPEYTEPRIAVILARMPKMFYCFYANLTYSKKNYKWCDTAEKCCWLYNRMTFESIFNKIMLKRHVAAINYSEHHSLNCCYASY